MSRYGGHSRTYREHPGTRRESSMVFTPERERTSRERRTTRSDLGGKEDNCPRNSFMRWGKQPRNKWIRGRPSHNRGRRYRARSEWQSNCDTGRGDGDVDLSYTDLRWHLHQRRRSPPDNSSLGRRYRLDSFQCSVSPRRLSDRREKEASSEKYEDTATYSTYEDVDKHDDLCQEYPRYWDCVVAEMEVRSEKRVDSKVELLSDISDDSLDDPLSRASPKVKSLILREETRSPTPKRHYSSNNKNHNSPTPNFDNSGQHYSSRKTSSNATRAAHHEKKARLSPGQIEPSNTDCKANTVRDDCSSSDSGSSSSSSSSSSSDTSECKQSDSCNNRSRMLPPEATSSSLILSTRSLLASRRGCEERGEVDDTSFITPNLEASILSSTLSSTDLSSSSATLSSSVLSSSIDLSSSAILSSSVLSSSLCSSSSDSGNASLLTVSPLSRVPSLFALEQLGRLMRWVLSSSMQRYMPSVRPPQLTGMQMGVQRDLDVLKWVDCGVQHVVMVEQAGSYVEAVKASHHAAWLSGKRYSVDWVCRDYIREVWPHQPVDVACSHLALHKAFASLSQVELFAHNVSCSLKEGSCLVATAFSAARVLGLIRTDESGRSYESRHFKLRIHGGYSARSTLPQFGVKISMEMGPGRGRFEDSLVQLATLEDIFRSHHLQLLTKRSYMQLFDETCSYSTCLRQLEELELVMSNCPGRAMLSSATQEIANLFDVIIFRKMSRSVR